MNEWSEESKPCQKWFLTSPKKNKKEKADGMDHIAPTARNREKDAGSPNPRIPLTDS